TDGWILNTRFLNILFNITPNSISNAYAGDRNQLLFVQCGNSVQELNRYLNSINKSLRTSGASNGQTISGAFSTGTHGAAFDFGATPDFVVGLHLILSQDRHIWLESASYPVVSDSFADQLKTEVVRDDELFNAALVNIGSFGFIHGVMIETEPLYLLEGYRQKIPYDNALKHIMETLDFTNSPLTHGSERPFHFQVVINQYDLEGGAYVTSMYKRPYNNSYTPPANDSNKAGPGDDTPVFIGKLTDFLPATIPLIVNQLVSSSLAIEGWWGTSSEVFTNTDIYGKVLSTAIGIPISYTNQVTDLLLNINNKTPFPGIFAYRYVKQSKATLAFTQYKDTCVVELDGVESELTWGFYNAIWEALWENNIPHTFHWGKIFQLDDEKVRQAYGNRRDRWVAARNKLLPKQTIDIFSNATLHNLGLDQKLP
ncbi:MAG TPA: FAD-binding protein, partial [Bacteroidales bacterium]